ncbi:hypothetical protein O181_035505 [Austropuccinia psidii MF-1]|uniref:Secreted protein n=1 Tax=Austropuccinia psidii MF-1 TaxID=1389203 RepID=A0A9Q3HB88_9BASI|nr:hypothetical protein [Austropuccinia psidii MF-1]
MIKISVYNLLLLNHILSLVTAGGSVQHCGHEWIAMGSLVKGNYVECINNGKRDYYCPAETCRTAQGSIDKKLFFRYCTANFTTGYLDYVWPTRYLNYPKEQTVRVMEGSWSNGTSGEKNELEYSAWCQYKDGNSQNNVRVTCKDCCLSQGVGVIRTC